MNLFPVHFMREETGTRHDGAHMAKLIIFVYFERKLFLSLDSKLIKVLNGKRKLGKEINEGRPGSLTFH